LLEYATLISSLAHTVCNAIHTYIGFLCTIQQTLRHIIANLRGLVRLSRTLDSATVDVSRAVECGVLHVGNVRIRSVSLYPAKISVIAADTADVAKLDCGKLRSVVTCATRPPSLNGLLNRSSSQYCQVFRLDQLSMHVHICVCRHMRASLRD
jgi:hypothetical protein